MVTSCALFTLITVIGFSIYQIYMAKQVAAHHSNLKLLNALLGLIIEIGSLVILIFIILKTFDVTGAHENWACILKRIRYFLVSKTF